MYLYFGIFKLKLMNGFVKSFTAKSFYPFRAHIPIKLMQDL